MRDLQEYKLVPFSEITNEARDIATAWCENYVRMGFDIQQKHKLASDIMNYAAQETAALREENERLKYWLKELLFFYENNSGPEYHQFSIRQIKELIADLPTEEPQLPQSESEP